MPLSPLIPPLCALLLALLSWQAATDGPVRSLDERFGHWLADSSLPSPAAQFFADLGDAAVALPVLVLALVYAALRGRRARAPRWWLPPLAAALAMAAVPALVVPLKTWIGRPGPPRMAGGAHEGFFPSGHAATAAVAYGAALLLLLPYARERARTRRPTPFIAYGLLNVAVGVGLVRQGYHWPLDVLGAWCLAGLVLWCLHRTLLTARRPGPVRPRPRASRAPGPPGP
ncbi:phosphatase PAP2 family protein [Streptomyces varsoviensis]|uniref:phosphatase PAP2 family protein n=1 Tax=Streptomyces varsoviensis TaxID=67373 RepID=UPI0033C432C1